MEEDFEVVIGGNGKRKKDTKAELQEARQRPKKEVIRSSARQDQQSRKRWNVLVAILEAKIMEFSNWDELTPGVLEKVRIECKVSATEIKYIWSEYTKQKNQGRNSHEISMISNAHAKAGSSRQWENEREQHDKDSRLRHYRVRHDSKGKSYPIEKVVEAIAEANNNLKQEASIRDLCAEILKLRDLYVPTTTLYRILHDFKFDVEVSYVKPILTLKSMRKRLCYVLGQLEPSREVYIIDGRPCLKFSPHINRVRNSIHALTHRRAIYNSTLLLLSSFADRIG
jgi:hypothetical protein